MEIQKTYEQRAQEMRLAKDTVMAKVYGWMSLGLIITAMVGFFVAQNETSLGWVKDKIVYIILVKFAIVLIINQVAEKKGNLVAGILFTIYSATTGLFLSLLTLSYTGSSIVSAMISSVGMFGLMSFWGLTTKKNLETVGQYCFFGLIGIIIAMLVNLIIGSGIMDMAISVIAIIVFLGLTAWDTQEIKSNRYYQKYPVLGALSLYLDLVNLFIQLLRIFGKSND